MINVAGVDFDKEAQELADEPVETYIRPDEMPGGEHGNDEFVHEDEFYRAEEDAGNDEGAEPQPNAKHRRSAKSAVFLLDMGISIICAMAFALDANATRLTPREKNDLEQAYEAFFAFYNYDLGGPGIQLALANIMVFGPKIYSAFEAKKAAKKEQAKQAERATTNPFDDPLAPQNNTPVVVEVPVHKQCANPACYNHLTGDQMKYCSATCRMAVNNTKKRTP